MAKPQSRNQNIQKSAPQQPSIAEQHGVQTPTEQAIVENLSADTQQLISEATNTIEEEQDSLTIPEELQLTEEEVSWFPTEAVETYLLTAANYQVADEPRRFSLRGLLMYRTLNASMKEFVTLLHDKLDTIAAYEKESPRWFNPDYVHPEKSAKADNTPSQQSKEVIMTTANQTPATNLTVNKETIEAFRALAKDLGGALVPEDALAKALAERVDQDKLNGYVDSMTTLAQKAEANLDGKWTRRVKKVTLVTGVVAATAVMGIHIGQRVREYLDNRDAAEA